MKVARDFPELDAEDESLRRWKEVGTSSEVSGPGNRHVCPDSRWESRQTAT